MDKVKIYLAVLKKHYFWVMCGLLVIVSLSVWYAATSSAASQYKQDKMQVEGAFLNIKGQVAGADSGAEPLANETFEQEVEKLRKGLGAKVGATWKELYDKQKAVFKWPFLKDAIEAQDIGSLKQNAPIPAQTRASYSTLFTPPYTEWQRLFDQAGILRPVAGEVLGLGAGATRAQEAVPMQGLIFWDKVQRGELVDRYDPKGKMIDVTTTWVRITQEDMWVFESMLNILASLNKNVQDPSGAHIKRIEALDLAQWAMKEVRGEQAGKVKLFKGKTPAASTDSAPPEQAALPEGEESVAVANTSDEKLLNGRYLDDKMEPLPFNAKHPFAEFKQLFVRMKLVMDQRWIGELLTACANAELPIEVRQITQFDLKPPQLKGVAARAARPGEAAAEPPPYDCTLELRGIVYIYNDPEDLQQLGSGAAPDPAKRKAGIPSKLVDVPRKGGQGPEAINK